ncbi:MAG: site-specific integrase [Rubrivivax sp.]|nr:MAG: site-specific integrase [Rubrivivax sp.]
MAHTKMKTPGTVYARGSVYWFKVKVPSDLAHLPKYCKPDGSRLDYATKPVSLSTKSKPEADAKAAPLSAHWAAQFLADRKALETQSPDLLPQAMVEAIAQRVHSAVLAEDAAWRRNPVALAQFLQRWWDRQERLRRDTHKQGPEGPYRPRPVPACLTPEGIEELADTPSWQGIPKDLLGLLRERNEGLASLTREALAGGYPGPFLGVAQKEALALGVNLGADGWVLDSAKGLRDACQEAFGRALDDIAIRDSGRSVVAHQEVPSASSGASKGRPAASTKGHTLRAVFDTWTTSGDLPSASTIRKKTVAVRLYEEFSKGALIESLDKGQGVEFVSFLLKKCAAQKTAKDHLEGVKSLLNFATDKLGWLEVNPWSTHTIQVKKSSQRKPWAPESLAKLFKSELFTAYKLPELPAAGGAAAYWVPLLGLYTGARQSELCQLRVADIEETPEGLALYVLRDGADAEDGTPETSTKTEASNRRLPVHSDLIALGFKDYWQDIKKAGHKVLFPDVRRAPGRSVGEYFSDWFLVYRRAQGLDKRWMDFHAFRHTASTRLTDAGVSDSVADYLTGHSSTGRGSARRYKAMQELRTSLEALKYPELGLVRVYPIP